MIQPMYLIYKLQILKKDTNGVSGVGEHNPTNIQIP